MLAVKNDYMFSYGKKNHYTSFLDSWTSDFFFFERIYTAITGFNGPKNHHYYIVLMWLLPEDGI